MRKRDLGFGIAASFLSACSSTDPAGSAVSTQSSTGNGAAPHRLAPVDSILLESRDDAFLIEPVALRRHGSRFVVLDERLPGLLVYASDGTLIRRVGRLGSGPGEFRAPWALALTGNRAVVLDVPLRRATVLDVESGTLLATFATPDVLYARTLLIDTAGLLAVGRGTARPAETRWFDIVRYDLQGRLLAALPFRQPIEDGSLPPGMSNGVAAGWIDDRLGVTDNTGHQIMLIGRTRDGSLDLGVADTLRFREPIREPGAASIRSRRRVVEYHTRLRRAGYVTFIGGDRRLLVVGLTTGIRSVEGLRYAVLVTCRSGGDAGSSIDIGDARPLMYEAGVLHGIAANRERPTILRFRIDYGVVAQCG